MRMPTHGGPLTNAEREAAKKTRGLKTMTEPEEANVAEFEKTQKSAFVTKEDLVPMQKAFAEMQSKIAFMQAELEDSAKIYEHLNNRIHDTMQDFRSRAAKLSAPVKELWKDFYSRFPKIYHCPKCKAVVNPQSEKCRGCGKAL